MPAMPATDVDGLFRVFPWRHHRIAIEISNQVVHIAGAQSQEALACAFHREDIVVGIERRGAAPAVPNASRAAVVRRLGLGEVLDRG